MPVREAPDSVTMITMITTCPACRTAFRINNEQLAARDGKVRCGQCSAVFDARGALEAELVGPAAESPPPTVDSPPQPEAMALPVMELAPLTIIPDHVEEAPEPIAQESPAQRSSTAATADPLVPTTEPKRVRRRVQWVAGSMLLVLILLIQLAFYFRGEIALAFPDMRPTIAELCATLDCRVPLPRRAEMISIESSDLQADPENPSLMVLTATLRNRAAFAQSHPSLELTLTDSQDQPLARRVLGTQDYLGPGASVEAGFTGNSELSIRVYIEATALKATGYRLYLFFP